MRREAEKQVVTALMGQCLDELERGAVSVHVQHHTAPQHERGDAVEFEALGIFGAMREYDLTDDGADFRAERRIASIDEG